MSFNYRFQDLQQLSSAEDLALLLLKSTIICTAFFLFMMLCFSYICFWENLIYSYFLNAFTTIYKEQNSEAVAFTLLSLLKQTNFFLSYYILFYQQFRAGLNLKSYLYFQDFQVSKLLIQQTFTCSKSIIETLQSMQNAFL